MNLGPLIQNCVAGLSSRITPQVSPFLPKMPPPLILPFCTNQVWTVPPPPPPFPWTFMRNSGVGGKGEWGWGFYQTTKNFLISPTIKIPLHAFTSSAIKNVIPSLSNSKFHVITLCKLHLQLQSFLLYHFFFSQMKALRPKILCQFWLIDVY